MSVTLMNGETLQKEWEYGSSKSKLETTTATLTITDRRIIAEHTRTGKMTDSFSREEIRNADISSYEVTTGISRKFALLCLGIFFVLAAIIICLSGKIALGFAALIPAAIFIILFFVIKKACVMLTISKKIEIGNVVSLRVGSILPENNKKKKSKKKAKKEKKMKVKVIVNPAVVTDISDTIAGLLNT